MEKTNRKEKNELFLELLEPYQKSKKVFTTKEIAGVYPFKLNRLATRRRLIKLEEAGILEVTHQGTGRHRPILYKFK